MFATDGKGLRKDSSSFSKDNVNHTPNVTAYILVEMI